MASLTGFNALEVEPIQSYSALPEGKYVAIATASEMKPNNKGTGQYLQFTFEVLEGPHKGRKVWARLNMVHTSPDAVKGARRELGAFCRAVGVIQPNDSSELHNRPVLLKLKVETDDRNRENNVIKDYEPVSSASASAIANAMPAQMISPPPAAAPGVAPWMR